MTAGCCRSLSTAASTERRAINVTTFLRHRWNKEATRCLVTRSRSLSTRAYILPGSTRFPGVTGRRSRSVTPLLRRSSLSVLSDRTVSHGPSQLTTRVDDDNNRRTQVNGAAQITGRPTCIRSLTFARDAHWSRNPWYPKNRGHW